MALRRGANPQHVAVKGQLATYAIADNGLDLRVRGTKGSSMRLITTILAAMLIVGLAVPADAHPRKKKYRSCDGYGRYERCDSYWWYGWRDLFPGYQARNPDNFRPGSRPWWKTMDMEGRGGHPRL